VIRPAPADVSTDGPAMSSTPAYDRFAAVAAVLAGVVGLLYAVAFVVLRSDALSALFLLLGGLLSSSALVALYRGLRSTDPGFALWGVVLALAGAIGALLHGGYDLANALHPPATANVDLPSQVDPRGLATFGIGGLGLLVLALLMLRGGPWPRGLGGLGVVLAVLLIVLYAARLIVLDPTSPLVLGPAALVGFVLNPLWYLWLGVVLWRSSTDKR
jgi:hypothetical protein